MHVKLGMVGGGKGSLIGETHRCAARVCGNIDFCAGALSSTPQKAKESGKMLGLTNDRNYESWEAMLNAELALPVKQRIDAVSIVTPNHMHYPVAKAFAETGIHVVCDKPLVHTYAQAQDLCAIAKKKGIVFAVTYNYTGYPLVKQARDMIRNGGFGAIRKVVVEYSQGWLSQDIENRGMKQAQWRTDPDRSGIAGAVADIGTHAENLVATVSGLNIAEISADITSFVPQRRLDDDANILVRYDNGARGVMIISQVSIGEDNGLKFHVYGERGGCSWRQAYPNDLTVWKDGMPEQIYKRGKDYLTENARRFSHISAGHPEGYVEAFSSLYSEIARHILAIKNGEVNAETPGFDYPTVHEGAQGVRFIEKVVESADSEYKWTKF